MAAAANPGGLAAGLALCALVLRKRDVPLERSGETPGPLVSLSFVYLAFRKSHRAHISISFRLTGVGENEVFGALARWRFNGKLTSMPDLSAGTGVPSPFARASLVD